MPARSSSIISVALVLVSALPLSAANAIDPTRIASRPLLSMTTSQSDLPGGSECQGAGASAGAGGAGASAGAGGASAGASAGGGGAGASAGGGGAGASAGGGSAGASAGGGGSAGGSGAAGAAGADSGAPGAAPADPVGSGPVGGLGPGTSSGAGGSAGNTGGIAIGSVPSAQQAAECDRDQRQGKPCSPHGFYSLHGLYFNAANYRSVADCLTAAHAGGLPFEVCRKP